MSARQAGGVGTAASSGPTGDGATDACRVLLAVLPEGLPGSRQADAPTRTTMRKSAAASRIANLMRDARASRWTKNVAPSHVFNAAGAPFDPTRGRSVCRRERSHAHAETRP